MKFIIPLMLVFMNPNIITMLSFNILILISLIFNQNNINSMFSMNKFMFNDPLSNILILLTIMSLILIIMSSLIFNKIFMLMLIMLMTLILTFSSTKTIQFYMMFETVLIPTFLLILYKGKQPERLQASIYMLVYTIMGSLPLLLGILFMNKNNFLMLIIMNDMIFIPLMFLLAFLMKLPMFFVHLWLPKAHVEAPLEGSMILAAVLLKLGGYGILRFIPLMINKIKYMNHWLISISMIGAMSTSMNCIRQKDMKMLVAYSSVAHMGMILASILTLNKIGTMGAIIMMISHGMSSSALFFLVNINYTKLHTRNILMFKGLLKMLPNLSFWWFMFLASNISAPPTTNLMSEIFMISSLMNWNLLMIFPIIMISIMTAIFSINLYINMNHNKPNMTFSEILNPKFSLSMIIHLIPLIMLITKTEIMLLFSLKKTMICGIMNLKMMFTSMLLMFLSLSFMILFMLLLFNSTFITMNFKIMSLMYFNFPISVMLDWMSTLFMSTVMLISSMILMFSMFYIPKNEQKQFNVLLLMFIISMILLILSDNIIFIILGWDGLGLSSYVLVVYYQNFSSSASGSITIFSNRIGDVMILMSIAMMTMTMNWNFSMENKFPMIMLLMLMTAACSKSAQFPFSAWLPAAMAAPTPVSALVHSSTLVTAGVFLMIRLMNNIHPSSMLLLMIISTLTTIYSSLSALWEQDMKKIIALSTLSQIAMMMFAISMKSPSIAIFHLITHALFKSTMFLCAGTMIHNSSYQDMRHMGSIYKNSPVSNFSLGLSSMALMGIPFTSGFFSKDLIVENTMSSKIYSIMVLIMLFSITLTSSYSLRMMLFSTKFFCKSSSLKNFHQNFYSNLSISIMTPMSIILGSMMMWIMPLNQFLHIPNSLKISIPMIMFMGMMFSLSFTFKKSKYIKLGFSGNTLWFLNFLSTNLFSKMFLFMMKFQKMDLSWQENYGPQMMFSQNKFMSKMPDKTLNILLFMLMLIIMTPLILMI